MFKYICLHGLSTDVKKKNDRTHLADYSSRFVCLQHTSCLAMPCVWPVDKIEEDWKNISTCQSNLVVEATRCFKCFQSAKYLCLYGGHMVCSKHVKDKHSWKTKTTSPYYCCGPVWPNPWQFMFIHQASEVLEKNMIKQSVSYNMQLLRVSQKKGETIYLTYWAHQKDLYPRQETLQRLVTEKHVQVWRISVYRTFTDVCTTQLTLQRCHIFWVSASLRSSLKHILKRYATLPKDSLLYIHRQQFYMQLRFEAAEKIECVVCQQRRSTNDFIESSCCLFPLNEMEPWV